MRRLLVILCLSGAAVVSAITPVTDQITVAATPIGFTPSKMRGATTAFCRLETAEIRYEFGGPTVTTTVGFLWEPGEEKTLQNTPQVTNVLTTFNAIRTGSTSGLLSCKYY